MNSSDMWKDHVYVDIRRKQATIVFKNAYGMFYDTIAMPFMKTRNASFMNPEILDRMMKVLKTEIVSKTGFQEFNLFFTVPDCFGINEKRAVYYSAKKYEMPVIRFYSDLDLMAVALAGDRIKSDGFKVLNLDDSYAELGEYEYEDDVLEKVYTYVFSKKDDMKYIHQKDAFLKTKSTLLVYSDEENAYEGFVAKTREICEGRDLTFNRIVMPVTKDIFQKGLEKLCLMYTARQSDLVFLQATGPFTYEISSGSDHEDLFIPDSVFPAKSKEFAAKYVSDTGITISVYERSGNELKETASWMFKRAQIKGQQIEARFVIEVDVGGMFYLVTGDQKINLFDLAPVQQEPKTEPKTEQKREPKIEPKREEKSELKRELKGESKKAGGTVEDIIKDLISVINNMEYGMQFVKNEGEMQGMRMIFNNTLDKLKKYGVTVINQTNVPFNVRFHNAVDVTDDIRMPADYVSRIVRSGYLYKGKVLQFADVVVNGYGKK